MSEIQFPQRHDYTPISPFKMFVKSNFPFIEATFEALDNYGLYCKIVEYLNQVIGETNDMATDVVAFTDFTTNYFENLDVQEEINNKLDEMAANGTLTTILAPLTQIKIVSSTSDMTETYRLYVLSSNNHIYQYNSSTNAFTDTGAVYSSVGNYLNVNSTIIFSTNYESLMPDLNGATDNIVYHFMLPNSDSYPAHMPERPEGKPTTLIVTKSSVLSTQLYITQNNIYYRMKYDSTWYDWVNVIDYTNDFKLNIITSSNYSTLLPDLNTISQSGKYSFLIAVGGNAPQNLPIAPDGKLEMLIHKKFSNSSAFQIYVASERGFYIRWKYSGTWTNWIDNSNRYKFEIINVSNYSTEMSDLNSVTKSGKYGLLFASNGNYPNNLPVTPSGKLEMLVHQTLSNGSAFQVYFSAESGIYMRWKYSNTWRAWYSASQKTIYVGTNEQFTTLKSAIEYSNTTKDVTIYVKDGTYDIYEEFGGDDFFESYTDSSTIGLMLSNNVHLIFSSNSKVVFNNTSGNTTVDTRFSIFNAGNNGFTLENCTIEGTNCRYLIHDERGSSSGVYINKYINCKFVKSGNGYKQCIGGGLGKNGYIIIDNCTFDSNDTTTDTTALLTYHGNNSSTDTASKSNVYIKNNYFKKGTIRVSWCGVSTLISEFLIKYNSDKI